MAQTPLWTFQDLVDGLLDQHEVERTGLNYRHARRAAIEALRKLQAAHDWTAYRATFTLDTVASQSSSTITYDHTGGTYERMVTLAAGTWPDWAAFGTLEIAGEKYHVEAKKSSTELTLTQASNPGSDLAAGTSYVLYRDTYPLPVNFRKLIQIFSSDDQRQLGIMGDSEQHFVSRAVYSTPDAPYHITIRGDQEYYGSLSLVFTPPPNSVKYYDILYVRTARDLRIDKYATGTVAVDAGGTTVTGTSTVFPAGCVGSVIRFSSSATQPTNIPGVAAGSSPVDNLYLAQRIITVRTSDTSLTVDSTPSSTALSGKGYTISDPLDIEWNSMHGALVALAEAEFSRLAGRKDWDEKAKYARLMLLEAIETDSRATVAPLRIPYDPWSLTTYSSADE